ncbi:unnamed protein product [Fraxinus pennsylvanica]|uniref:Uncharacterized protein n=1 Tax=Fraxinus pennsylvanica TaxID=56036 RepID=A0AAD2A157_9LAMI|nr:unnamed protein product [Fraxinus pennsylvanica]
MNAGRVKIYEASPEVLKLLSGTRLRVSIIVTNDLIYGIATNQTIADQCIRDNVLTYYPNTKIRSILVGNEVLSYDNQKMWADLVPAMQKIKKSLVSHNIHNIKVGTPLAIDVVESIFPPSSGKFKDEISDKNSGPGTKRHWGMLNPNGTPIYELDLTGVRPGSDYPQTTFAGAIE